jgi:hypothetical protein
MQRFLIGLVMLIFIAVAVGCMIKMFVWIIIPAYICGLFTPTLLTMIFKKPSKKEKV